MNLWDNVDKVIKESGENLSEISDRAGIKYDTVRNWRTRHIYPRVDEAKALADALGVTVEKLFFDEDVEEGYRKEIDRLRKKEEKLNAIEALFFSASTWQVWYRGRLMKVIPGESEDPA